MSDKIVHVTDDSFEQDVLGSDAPVLVDYWAEWCGPCKAIAPILEEIGAENAEKITIGKLNIDEHPQPQATYGIMSIPTMIVFQGDLTPTALKRVAETLGLDGDAIIDKMDSDEVSNETSVVSTAVNVQPPPSTSP